MNIRSFAPLFLVLLAASGCNSCDPVEPTVPTAKPSATVEVPETPRPYVERRWVGEVATGCDGTPVATARGSFKVSPVFPAGAQKLPDAMAKLCAFEWTGAQDPTSDDVATLASARSTRLVPDPPVVVSVASRDPAWPARAERLRRRFLVQLGLVDKTGARITLPAPATFSPVFIGVPDSSPAPDPAKDPPDLIPAGNNPHGYNVAWTAKLLSCTDDSGAKCFGTPRTELALGLREPPGGAGLTSDPAGGTFGTRSALATAIWSLVQKQLAEEKAGKVKHMVLNLSVGWEEGFECAPIPKGGQQSDNCPDGETPVLNQQSRAVLHALDYASCKGAAIIAASGNDPGLSPTPAGPMLPGAWEGKRAPSAAYCKCQFGDSAGLACDSVSREDPEDTRPLLHAVGAVTPSDVPIPISRVRSSPRLVAPGSLVVMFPGAAANPAEPRYPLSGTSMSTAAMSGAVAAVWAHRPELDAHAVVQAVYESGVVLGPDPGDEADFCLAKPPGGPGAGSCDRVRRISLCDAMKATPEGASLECPKLESRRPPKPLPIVTIPIQKPTKMDFVNLLGLVYGQPIIPVCPDCLLKLKQPYVYVSTPESVVENAWFQQSGALKLTLSDSTYPMLGIRLFDPTGARLPTPGATTAPATITPTTGGTSTRIAVEASHPTGTEVQTATLSYMVRYAGGRNAMVTEEVAIE